MHYTSSWYILLLSVSSVSCQMHCFSINMRNCENLYADLAPLFLFSPWFSETLWNQHCRKSQIKKTDKFCVCFVFFCLFPQQQILACQLGLGCCSWVGIQGHLIRSTNRQGCPDGIIAINEHWFLKVNTTEVWGCSALISSGSTTLSGQIFIFFPRYQRYHGTWKARALNKYK